MSRIPRQLRRGPIEKPASRIDDSPPLERLMIAVAYGEAWQNMGRGSPIRSALEDCFEQFGLKWQDRELKSRLGDYVAHNPFVD